MSTDLGTRDSPAAGVWEYVSAEPFGLCGLSAPWRSSSDTSTASSRLRRRPCLWAGWSTSRWNVFIGTGS